MDHDKNKVLLNEWTVINSTIASIDARMCQGTGILLVISIGSFSLINWHSSKSIIDPIAAIIISIVSLVVLIWQCPESGLSRKEASEKRIDQIKAKGSV